MRESNKSNPSLWFQYHNSDRKILVEPTKPRALLKYLEKTKHRYSGAFNQNVGKFIIK
jgi:hypothetical protein